MGTIDALSPPPKAAAVAPNQVLELERSDGGRSLTHCDGASLTAGDSGRSEESPRPGAQGMTETDVAPVFGA